MRASVMAKFKRQPYRQFTNHYVHRCTSKTRFMWEDVIASKHCPSCQVEITCDEKMHKDNTVIVKTRLIITEWP